MPENWDFPDPFLHSITARKADEDEFGHVNNARYLNWADETAWAHWDVDIPDFPRKDFAKFDHGMAIVRSEADYLGHLKAGDTIDAAVWITHSDGRLRAERRFQFRRADTGETVFRGLWKLICFRLSTGRPTRMSEALIRHYRVIPSVHHALMTES